MQLNMQFYAKIRNKSIKLSAKQQKGTFLITFPESALNFEQSRRLKIKNICEKIFLSLFHIKIKIKGGVTITKIP